MIQTINLQKKHMSKETVYYIKLKELNAFLQRTIKTNLILQSNFKKGIDRDSLLIQQKSNLKTKLQRIQIETKNYETQINKENKLPEGTACKLSYAHLQNKQKKQYIKKNNFLFNKQKIQIINLNRKTKQAAKNKKKA